jgi:hypothetical protein
MKLKSLLWAGAGWLLSGISVSPAAELTSVPMGGSMVHANIMYNAAQNRLEAHVDPVVPQLTPLDVSNPEDSFAPADPWFSSLDPAQQGQAFNRQYGFVMDAGTDALPAGTGIWIRMVSNTPGVATYRYRSSAGAKSWDPIFGTAGSTNLFQWNLSMFHPAIAAPPTNGTHSATFEAFLVDANTGQEMGGIAHAPFTLNWTIVASARELNLTPDHVLTWGASATNYVLECTDTLPATSWTLMTNRPVVRDGKCIVTVECTEPVRFYRLRRLP